MWVVPAICRCVFCGLRFKLEAMDADITPCCHTYNLLCVEYHFEKENTCMDSKSTVGAEWYLAWGLKVHSYGMWFNYYVIVYYDSIILHLVMVLHPLHSSLRCIVPLVLLYIVHLGGRVLPPTFLTFSVLPNVHIPLSKHYWLHCTPWC